MWLCLSTCFHCSTVRAVHYDHCVSTVCILNAFVWLAVISGTAISLGICFHFTCAKWWCAIIAVIHLCFVFCLCECTALHILVYLQQRPIISELDTPPSMEETTRAVGQIQAGKAPGPDGIPIEIFKAGEHHLLEHLTKLFQLFWEHGQLPEDLCDANTNIIHLCKNKGDRSSCDNHCGISLLSIVGKILAQILLNRISKHLLDDIIIHGVREPMWFQKA